jgi:3-oxoacyl-[acyl-carrier-protein] synthase III
VFLHGIGHFHPDTVIDNEFLVDLDIGVDDEWILQRVGIRTRRTVLPLDYIKTTANRNPRAASEASLYTNAQTGAAAARMALERAGLSADSIGMVVAGGCSPEHTIPAEACVVAAELGLNVPAFDINSACSSFGVQLRVIEQMGDHLPDFVLIVNPENNTRTVDYSDRANAVLWGDASSAAVVSARVPSRVTIGASVMDSDPGGWAKVTIPAGGHFAQDGATVQAFAIRKMVELLGGAREQLNCNDGYFIGHQANLLALKSVCSRSNVADEKHLYNVDEFGNCGAAGAPSVVSQHWSRFRPGDTVAMAVVGSGLTWAGLWVRFAGCTSVR